MKTVCKRILCRGIVYEIKEYIGRPVEEYRVASVGLHPAIAHIMGSIHWIRTITFIRYHTNMNLEKLLQKN